MKLFPWRNPEIQDLKSRLEAEEGRAEFWRNLYSVEVDVSSDFIEELATERDAALEKARVMSAVLREASDALWAYAANTNLGQDHLVASGLPDRIKEVLGED